MVLGGGDVLPIHYNDDIFKFPASRSGDRPTEEGCQGGGAYSFFPGPGACSCSKLTEEGKFVHVCLVFGASRASYSKYWVLFSGEIFRAILVDFRRYFS